MHKKIHGRHGARFVALQALYAWSMGARLSEVEMDSAVANIGIF